jgi:protein-disulfide isomerase
VEGYRRLFAAAGARGERPIQGFFYLSPDQNFVSQGLRDLRAISDGGRVGNHQLAVDSLHLNLPAKGSPKPLVTLTVFSDFQCPYCKDFATLLKRYFLPKYGDDIRVVFRHRPLAAHLWARSAAEAAACLFAQSNDAFWAFHDLLFDAQQDVNVDASHEWLDRLAEKVDGVNISKYKTCRETGDGSRLVYRDIEAGLLARIDAVPTILIDESRYEGLGDPDVLDGRIAAAIRNRKQ